MAAVVVVHSSEPHTVVGRMGAADTAVVHMAVESIAAHKEVERFPSVIVEVVHMVHMGRKVGALVSMDLAAQALVHWDHSS